LDEDESVVELGTNALKHPSPILVLDGFVYRDYLPFPVKQIYEYSKGIAFVF